jgi:Ca-activated chloride channel family protein
MLLPMVTPLLAQLTAPGVPYTVTVDVDLVLFNVTVLDKNGHPVPGLAKERFHIFEDGREEQIKLFQPEDAPATVGLVIDSSGSMLSKHNDVIAAALEFAEASNAQDEVFIVNFNDRVSMSLPESIPFTSDPRLLRTALLATTISGRTALYDAVAAGLQHLKAGTRQRKALVVFSDGGDNASRRHLEDVVRMAQQSSATVYSIGMYSTNEVDNNPKVLRRLAKLTGGEAYTPHRRDQMHEIWQKIANGLRSQYTIGYVSSNRERDGRFRRVNVVALGDRGKRLAVNTRTGYVAGN